MRDRSRRIAVVINSRWRRYASIDFGGYCDALLLLGHSPVLVCHANERGDQAFPVIEAAPDQMQDERFWQKLNIEAVIFFNWLRASTIVAAMKQAGLSVISRGDTDGHASAKVFPLAAWLALEDGTDNLLISLRKAKIWLNRYLNRSPAEDRELLETIDATDAVAIECDKAAANLGRILAHYRRSDLSKKVHTIPHSVGEDILAEQINLGARPNAIICGGRWDDPQKDALLLASALHLLLRRHTGLQALIIGPGGDRFFQPLVNQYQRVTWLRQVDHCRMASLLANSRVILSTSRWEGYSIIALEALCMGCTLVAPSLPGFVSMVENGRFGTIAGKRRPVSIMQATEKELELWDQGRRAPAEIAAIWRSRTNNQTVVTELLSLI
jgi:glycosyltransferase involved in cell wall biosynthesis